jgi:23S rRNA (cytidine1920-2'-O)/16S rRNA (cytidine1409-2'-O)-methyltransferase
MKKERADKILVEQGLAGTCQKAQALIMAGLVSTGGRRVEKAGQPLDPEAPLSVEKPLPYVGRGGLKLEQALDEFGVDPAGRVCADIGSSTGGFTDCLLQRGAARVFCVDVDIRQLDDRIRRHPRVVTIEKNARTIVPADFPEIPALVVMDVSFISVTKILPALRAVFDAASLSPSAQRLPDTLPLQDSPSAPLSPTAPPVPSILPIQGASSAPGPSPIPSAPPPLLLSLIKPQFEAGRGQVGKKGVIRDAALHAEILTRIIGEAAALGFALEGLVRCTTRGQKGNQEFFARFTPGRMEPPGEVVIKWIREAAANETD